jgi:hypothetical protein
VAGRFDKYHRYVEHSFTEEPVGAEMLYSVRLLAAG